MVFPQSAGGSGDILAARLKGLATERSMEDSLHGLDVGEFRE